MAKIIGQSNCTEFLTRNMRRCGVSEINNFNNVEHFYKNFSQILSEAENIEKQNLDNQIAQLKRQEINLIKALEQKSGKIRRFFTKIHIKITKYKYKKLEKNYDKTVQKKVAYLHNAHQFLERNISFYYGSIGEEAVIQALSKLPDTYYVLNDISIEFSKAVHWSKYNEWVRSAQIDHVVVGPTGIFLIETDNLRPSSTASCCPSGGGGFGFCPDPDLPQSKSVYPAKFRIQFNAVAQ